MIYGKTILLKDANGEYRCNEPALVDNKPSVSEIWWHPNGSEFIFSHEDDAILECSRVTPIDSDEFEVLKQEYYDLAPAIIENEGE